MVLHARLNENDAVVELRDFPEVPIRHWRQVLDAEGKPAGREEILPPDPEHPHDIPHKNVRWRPYVEQHNVAGFDPAIHEAVDEIRIEKGRVVRHVHFVDRSLEVVREAQAEKIRAAYRDRIVDALPDMTKVGALAKEREAKVAEVMRSSTAKAARDAAG